MRRVILESPYAAETEAEVAEHVAYARLCVRDALVRGEAPFASHLLYTQPGVLSDAVQVERETGMEAGWAWMVGAQACVVYLDRGVSAGMAAGMERAKKLGLLIERRSLYETT
ncbi:hypothetical protein UFOVP32_38 [uncultured Caudovirales phage]|uniref:DUF7768 domain-containing protein n=1 Tax=uncultured Caudovirales phage TaxID=2100421 RepID=A0A6J5KQP5_9CAUD|nr:hypothetical protein UFOVP32_38 [uncultured Caudovirales phage]CAB4123665.1 hypothetical protein UFOVP50_38 [uncultured Caudovirales phage]